MVTAVIPNWNRAELLAAALDSLRRQTRPPDQIIVVDNGSGDRSVSVAQAAGARVIEMGGNAGFARAVNAGIEAASGEFVAILNNDIELAAQWLEGLLNRLRDSDHGFATGKLLSPSGLIDGAWDAVCRGACAWRCGQGRPDGDLWSRERAIRIAPLTAVLFRSSVFRSIGTLDHIYGSYLEDIDLGIRCAMAGITGVYVPEAVGRHRGSATYGQWSYDTVRLLARNQIFLIARNYPDTWVRRYGWQVMVAHMLWGTVAMRHGQFRAYARGKMEGVRLFPAVRRDRRLFDAQAFHNLLTEAEQEIRTLQKATGYDLFWRLYFALT
jgi:hypothetical protein